MIPQLTETIVLKWVGQQSFERGQRYFRDGHILDPRRQGETLKARCLGSNAPDYRVEAKLTAQGLAAGACSCPVGSGGRCKHVAALLLAWLQQPESFRVVEDLETALNRREKAELIALIGRMIARVPDLEELIDLPVVDAGKAQPVNLDAIRHQVSRAFSAHGRDYDDRYDAASDIADGLSGVISIAQEYVTHGDAPNAVAIFQTVMEEVLEEYESVDDEGGNLAGVVEECVAGLGACLAAATQPTLRESILGSLFKVFDWDVKFGGIGMGDDAPGLIAEHATPDEKQQVAAWVRAELPYTNAAYSDYQAPQYGAFLLELQAETLDDETYLSICRMSHRWSDLVERQLALGRLDDAIAVARTVNDHELLSLANQFVAYQHGDVGERLVRERAETSKDSRLTEWLKNQAVARGDLAQATTLIERLLFWQPSLVRYVELRKVAGLSGQWDAMRPTILASLAEQKSYSVLTQIYLDENDVDKALATLEQTGTVWGRWDSNLRLQVAEAAAASRPEAAIRIFVDEAEGQIKQKDRQSYAIAATHLLHVRDIYIRQGKNAAWNAWIADLRQRYNRLSALKDELKRAGL